MTQYNIFDYFLMKSETLILSIEISIIDPKEQPAFAKLLLKKVN